MIVHAKLAYGRRMKPTHDTGKSLLVKKIKPRLFHSLIIKL